MEIIPLIDVIFFLLATFVLFTLTLHRVRVIDAVLPDATHLDSRVRDETTCFLHTSADGVIQWSVGTELPETITLAELPLRLDDYLRRVAVPRVLLRSDGKGRLGTAVGMLDAVRKARIREVAIETRVTAQGM